MGAVCVLPATGLLTYSVNLGCNVVALPSVALEAKAFACVATRANVATLGFTAIGLGRDVSMAWFLDLVLAARHGVDDHLGALYRGWALCLPALRRSKTMPA
jgi:hypothetical protein